ncbi:MAG: MBL fold metallo-hydrolase [Bauldia sp.]|nr:MBL fold metallo-hydrolase [Bauldia sp.]
MTDGTSDACSRRAHRRLSAALAIGALAAAGVPAGCVATGDMPVGSSHHADGRFHNVGTFVAPDDISRDDWRHHTRRMFLGLFEDADDLPPGHVLTPATAREGVARAEKAELAVTWIGHATTLIRIGGKWVLTDPVLMGSVGSGPVRLERLVPPRPSLEELPDIDVILISHADHDHLDLPTLRRLARRNPAVEAFVPAGTAPLMRKAGLTRVHELDWFESGRDGDLSIEAVPAIHGVRRPPYGLNAMSWSGWILSADGNRVYFAGDTGYGSIFEEIRRRTGPVDVALVPIGAWSPRWFQEPFHVDPEQAARIAHIMGAGTAIGIHWGTFPLSEEAPTEQRRRFMAAGGTAPRIGETLILRP